MNEKYNSEKNLGNTYDSYQMPFENEAFEKFKLELDKEDQKKKVFWWRRLSLILIPIFLIGFVSTYAFFQYQNTKEKSSGAYLENGISTTETIAPSSLDTAAKTATESTIETHSNQISPPPSNTRSTRLESTSKSVTQASTSEQSVQDFSNLSSDKEIQSTLSNTITTNSKVSDRNLNPSAVDQSSSLHSTNEELSATSTGGVFNSDIAEIDNRASILPLTELPLLNLSIAGNPHLDQMYFLTSEIKPYIEPFKKYFYINPRGGFVINDNFGSSDPYLSILKSKEYTYGGVLAYQFSRNYALELSFSQHDFSVGYHILDTYYSRKNGTKATVLKAALVSKLWSPFKGVNFNMTNGIAIMSGDNGSFGKGSSSIETPDFIQRAVLERLSISSSKHYLYASGLQANFRLSKNLECSLSSEYNIGFQPWIDTLLKYIEGEGVIRTVDSRSNGSFFAFNLGLKYNLRK